MLFGLLGMLDIPLFLLGALALFLLRPELFPEIRETFTPPPAVACDTISATNFELSRFQSGLGGELEQDTLFQAGSEYLIQETLIVPAGRRLLIEPGATLIFERGAGLEVRGALYACGSERDPVTMTSEDREPESWFGVQFYEAKEDSVIAHALIQFAGDRALYLEKSAPALVDVDIANSGAFPISSDGYELPEIFRDVDLSNNPFEAIEIRGGTEIEQAEVTWPNLPTVYVVTGSVVIGTNTALTIEPGTTVKFWQPQGGGPAFMRTAGLLKAEDVRFTSVYDDREIVGGPTFREARDPEPGDWGGLSFVESSDNSYLRDVLVQYAGQDREAIIIESSSPELSGVTIADSASYPLGANADALPRLSDLTLIDNQPGSALLIRGDSAVLERESHVWGILGGGEQLVRVIRGTIRVEPEATLVIEPGVVIKFEPDSRLVVQGTLEAIGGSREDEKIVFTSLRDDDYGGQTDKNTSPQDSRSWGGLIFEGADESSILQNAIIRYGPLAFNDSDAVVSDLLIRDSDTAAIWLTPNAEPTLSSIELQENEMNGAALTDGRLERDRVWAPLGAGDVQIVRILTGSITIPENVVLRIDDGAILKADSGGKLTVNGELDVRGRPNNPVIFTSLHDDSGGGDTNQALRSPGLDDWPGIEASAAAALSIGYAEIRYAKTGLTLRGGVMPEIGEQLRVVDGDRALFCDGRGEMPDNFVTGGNLDNDRLCPSE